MPIKSTVQVSATQETGEAGEITGDQAKEEEQLYRQEEHFYMLQRQGEKGRSDSNNTGGSP